MNKNLKNVLLIFFSVLIAVLVAEGLSRVFFDPIDFLKPKRVSDEVLRYKLEPGSGAHDSWGFRNKSVPESANTVVIGDSHTYGISATASNSWPAIYEDLSGKTVYSLSLGGYGPAEYLYLMEEKALKLKPDLIIVGLYLGNDLLNTFNSVYSVTLWEDYRNPDTASTYEIEEKNLFSYGLSDWLGANSVLYRMISSSSIGDDLRQRRRINKGDDIVMLEVEDYGIHTGFTPDSRLKGLDLSDPKVREGLRLTLGFFKKMNQLAQEKEIDFLVVIIPTKESVFSEFIKKSDKLSSSDKLNWLISNEDAVNRLVKAYLKENNISYLDVLEPLREGASIEQIYPNNFGGHTNKNGYRIIAKSINQHFKSMNLQ